MNDNIKDLIDRLRRYQDYALLEPDKLNPLKIMLDCVEAADELEKAYADIEEMNNVDISNPSQIDVGPEKELFEYVDTKYPEIPETIRTAKVMDEETEKKLVQAIEECKKAFMK